MSLAVNEITSEEVNTLSEKFETQTLEQILGWAWDRFGVRAGIGTSFQGAGLVMIHHALQAGMRLPIFTLDTDLHFPETMELKERLQTFFGTEIEPLRPALTLAQQESQYGPALWTTQPDTCCYIRKVEPLREKLATLAVWLTGLRRQQSDTREKTPIMELYEFDHIAEKNILKMNPMANWSREAIWEYIHSHKIPYNPLHDRGYPSIGCMPCTKATSSDNERAGRWTGFEKTECGIHTSLKRIPVRKPSKLHAKVACR